MKTFYYVLMAACLAGGLASCSKDNPSDDPTPTLSVDNEEITLNATNASSVQLTVPAGCIMESYPQFSLAECHPCRRDRKRTVVIQIQ